MVYPPVDTDFFQPDGSRPEDFALVVSALVPYKRLEIAVDACRNARMPLTIVGDGPERVRLERRAADTGSPVVFRGRVSNGEVRDLYRRAAFVLLPGEEDFGIVPIEAQACGRPVVALGSGGAAETVVAGETGILVDEADSIAFADAIARARNARFDSTAIRRHAERFSRPRFADQLEDVIRDTTRPD